MKRLSQSLEEKWQIPVKYFQQSYPTQHSKKWLKKENETIFPLSMDFQTAGHIKVSSQLNEDQTNKAYHLIQWTLDSLGDVFKKCNTSFYSGSKEIYPLLIQSVDPQISLKQVYELYEKSPARSFIHCHSKVFDRSLFSSHLDQTLIFISELSALSKENQLFLSHFIRNSFQNKKTPLVVGSVANFSDEIKTDSKIIPSLLESFVSFRSYDKKLREDMYI